MNQGNALKPAIPTNLDPSEPEYASALLDAWAHRLPGVDASAVPLYSIATALGRQVEIFLEGVLKPQGTQLTDYRVLAALYTSDPQGMTPVHLNTILQQTSAGITKTISRVEQAGYIQRKPNPADSRSVIVELTTAGKEEIGRLCTLVAKEQNKKLAWMSDEQRATALAGLQVFLQALR